MPAKFKVTLWMSEAPTASLRFRVKETGTSFAEEPALGVTPVIVIAVPSCTRDRLWRCAVM